SPPKWYGGEYFVTLPNLIFFPREPPPPELRSFCARPFSPRTPFRALSIFFEAPFVVTHFLAALESHRGSLFFFSVRIEIPRHFSRITASRALAIYFEAHFVATHL